MAEGKHLTENNNISETAYSAERKPISLVRPEGMGSKPVSLEKKVFPEQPTEGRNVLTLTKPNYYTRPLKNEYLAENNVLNIDCIRKVREISDVRVGYNKITSTFDLLFRLCLATGLALFLLGGIVNKLQLGEGSFGVFGIFLIPVSVVLKNIKIKTEEIFTSRPVRSVIKCEGALVKVIPDDPLNKKGKVVWFKSMQTDVPEIILHSKVKCGIGCTHAVLKVSDIERVKLEQYLKDNNIEYTGSSVNKFK